MEQLRALATAPGTTLRDMAPILAVLGLFDALVLGGVPERPGALGLAAVLVGLTLFVRGLAMSLFPPDGALADAMARRGHPVWLLGFALALGFGSTAAEPALAAVVRTAPGAIVGDPEFPATEAQLGAIAAQIRYGVAVGLGLVLGVCRILRGWPLIALVLPGYGLVATVAVVSEAPFGVVAQDAGTAATSTINIRLLRARGIGLEGTLLPLGAELAEALSARAVARGDAVSFAAAVGFAVALGGRRR